MNCADATAETLVSRAGVGQCSSPTADPIVSLGRGEDGLAGGFSQPVHNFIYQQADWPRLVPVGFDGVVETCIFYPFHEVTYD